MARYNEVSARTWNSKDFASLSERAKLLWLFFLTGAIKTPLPGIYNAGIGTCTDHLKITKTEFLRAFKELTDRKMALADWDYNVVYLPNWHLHNRRPANSNVVKGWVNLLETIPDCSLKQSYIKDMEKFSAGKIAKTVNEEIDKKFLAVSTAYHSQVKKRFPHLQHLREQFELTCLRGAEELDRLVRLDGHTIDVIEETLEWVVQSYTESGDFNWLTNMQSLRGIRMKSSRNGNMKFENVLNSKATHKAKSKSRLVLTDYKLDTSGFYIGYCDKCGGGDSYDKNELFIQESKCCRNKIQHAKKRGKFSTSQL